MTIQQGTTDYVYPLTDMAMPEVIKVLNYVKGVWAERATCRVMTAMVPFRDDANYTLAMADVLETNGRYAGPLSNFPVGATISSEASLAAHECARKFYQAVDTSKVRYQVGDYRDSPGFRMFANWFNRGQGRPQTPLRYTVQSIVEHYLFGAVPVAEADQKDALLMQMQPAILPTRTADDLDYFRTLMGLYEGANQPLGYWHSDKAGMTCSIYLSYPAIPKSEVARYQGVYDIDGFVRYYHGLFSQVLTGEDADNYLNDNWYARIAGLVRSVVYCHYWWSLRVEQHWPLPSSSFMTLENGTPMLQEDYSVTLLE